jgi:hypothetical protein
MGVYWSQVCARIKDSRGGDLFAMPRPVRLSQVRAMIAALGTMSTFLPRGQLAAPFNS